MDTATEAVSSHRLSHDDLVEITGSRRTSGQVKWFKTHFKVDVPHDRKGPIINKTSYDALVAKQLGLISTTLPRIPDIIIHPKVKHSAKRAI